MQNKMSKDWKEYKLGNIAKIIGGGTPSTKNDAFFGGNIPWITPKDMVNLNYRYISGGEVNLTETGLKKSSAVLLPQNTILFSSRAPIGYVAIAKNEISTNQGFRSLVCAEKIALPQYIYYAIQQITPLIKNYANGATFQEISGGTLGKIPITLPPIGIQKIIAKILNLYDDLLENNRQKISTLEEMAQLLYREWFVEFRFPGYEKHKFVDSELGKIPEGWIFSKVIDVANIFRGISYRSENLVDKGVPFFTINCIYRNGGFKFDGIKYYEGNYKESQLIKPNEIIIGVTDMTQARLIVGSVARIPSVGVENGLISMDLVRAKAKASYTSEYLYSMLRYSDFTRTIKEFANGANVLHLSPRHIEKFRFVLPTKTVRDQFVEIMLPIYRLMDNLVQKNVLAVAKRDLLLPKLMSGELDVSKLDIKITKN